MSATRAFLALQVIVWLPYAVYCFLQPDFLAGAAGVGAATATGTTELRAMYGGLQAAIGVLCAAALVRPSLVQPALVMLAFLSTGLGTTRALGLALDGSASGYTLFAIAFELVNATLALALLRQAGDRAPATA